MTDRDPQENLEQIMGLARGQKGEQGDEGPRGPAGLRGLPQAQARAIVYLFVVNILLIGLGYGFIAHTQDSYQASQQREQQAARRTGEIVEQRICLTMRKLAANQPPAGNPLTNPSRRYDQQNHAILDQLGPDLGCGQH